MTLTSMSDLSLPPGFGIDARTWTARVSRETSLETCSTVPWVVCCRNGKPDFHPLADGHLGLIDLVDVRQHPEMVQRRDDHQDVRFVVADSRERRRA